MFNLNSAELTLKSDTGSAALNPYLTSKHNYVYSKVADIIMFAIIIA